MVATLRRRYADAVEHATDTLLIQAIRHYCYGERY